MSNRLAVSVAITGASGACYGVRLVNALLSADKIVFLMISQQGSKLLQTEMGVDLSVIDYREKEQILLDYFSTTSAQLKVLANDDWNSCVASGSSAPKIMIICPCSMSTLSSVACGSADTLIKRAADVVIKEQGKLILVPRETPLSAIHLENMLKLARLGCVILPPSPGFYSKPDSIEQLVDFIVARIMDQADIEHCIGNRWGE